MRKTIRSFERLLKAGMNSSVFIFLMSLLTTYCTNVFPNDGQGELNNSCNSEKDCRHFGYVCKQNNCQCDQWYIPNKDNKVCVGGVDQKCLYDEHCIEGAYCMNQVICKCKRDKPQILHQGFICAGQVKTSQNTVVIFFTALFFIIYNYVFHRDV